MVWPILLGRGLHSTGNEFLERAGLYPQHVGIFIGMLGLMRMGVLGYYGQFWGACPWVRAVIALIAAVIWTEFLTALAMATVETGFTSSGIPNYFGLIIGELIVCHRAVTDARRPGH